MGTASLSGVIVAPSGDVEEQPCHVMQQHDAADTVPCSGNQGMLNELLRFMGFDIPAPEQPEEYSTQINIKPKNAYTNLNISFSENVDYTERWEQSETEQTVSISSSDFVAFGSGGYVDLAAKLNLVETDKIKSARWTGTVHDADLSPFSVKPSISIDTANHLPLPQPVNAELLVTVSENYQALDLTISPRDGETDGAYQSSLIVNTDGCDAQPTRYELNIPDCYQNSIYDKYGWPGSGDGIGDVTAPGEGPPEFVDPKDAENEWCLCGNHKLQSRSPSSLEEQDISNICYGGPCDGLGCVPSDREEGDEYC